MANVTAALAVPSANGVGAPSGVSVLGPDKTIVVTGNIEAVLAVQVSEDGVSYCTVVTFTAPGSTVLPGTVAAWMRIVVSGYKRGSAVCNVGAEVAVNDFAILPVPAGDGTGAAVDVSAFGSLWTAVIGELGSFLGALAIEVSQDGSSWGQAFSTFTGSGCESRIVSAAWARVRRSSFNVYAPGPMSVSLGIFRSDAGAVATTFIQDGAGAVTRTSQDKERETVSVLDYLNGSDVRSAIVDALAYLATVDGGTLHFPKRATPYDIDNTGLGPIIWTENGVWLVGDSATATNIRNVSTDGTDLISFDGAPSSIQRCGFRNMKIESLATAGHIWSFVQAGISFSRWENLWVIQQATGKAIMYGRFVDDDPLNPGGGGMFENQFVNGVYEHGTGSSGTIVAATVPAFDLEATLSLIVLNAWQNIRVNCHGSLAPFWDLHNTDASPGSKKYIHQNEFLSINCELPRRGLIRLRGHASGRISNITYYDLGLNGNGNGIDGHLIEIGQGSGGRYSQHNIIEGVQRNGSGTLLGVAGTELSVTSITRVGTTATLIASATIPWVDVGMRAYIVGANETDYNGRQTVLSVSTTTNPNDTITYEVANSPATPATGAITVAEGALDFKLASGNECDQLIACQSMGGTSASGDAAEADVAGSSALVTGHIADPDMNGLLVFRASATQGAQLELGSDASELHSTMRVAEVSTDRLTPRAASFINWSFKNDFDGLPLQWASVGQVSIGAGRCRSDDDTEVTEIDSNEAIILANSGASGLDTGVEAPSTMYDAYLIWAADGAPLPAGLACVSGAVPVMPANYDKKRYVGSFRNNAASDIIKFTMVGSGRQREVWYDDTLANLVMLSAGGSVAGANVDLSGLIPVGARRPILLAGLIGAAAGNVMKIFPALTSTPADWGHLVCQVAAVEIRQQLRMMTNSSRQVKYSVTDASDDAFLWVLGYELGL